MAIVKEWECAAHGGFDSGEPVCPYGCRGTGMVERAFRTPPSIQTAGYRSVNATIDSLAAEAGVTQINQRGGDGMLRTDWHARKRMSESLEMMGHGDLAGQDLSRFFVSASNVGAIRAKSGDLRGPLARDATGHMAAQFDDQQVPFGPPKIRVAGEFDGREAGLPAGDTA